MHRRPTTLLHDYKPSGNSKPKKTKALQWFAVGLGVPLIGLLLISTMSSGPSTPTSSENPSLVASGSAPPLPERLPFEVPELEIVPEFDSIVVTIGRGDTMDGIFRRNDLNLGHLAAIASLEEPRQLFRRLQPGDEFEIVHDHGSIVSLYAVLDLTSALNVTRGDDGYQAEIVERPIEIRTRMAYGVITNSLFESGAEAGLSDRVIMNMAGIFAWDIDFVFDIRQGDNYYVHYEEIWQDGEFVQDGEIIVAEFNNDGDTFHAIRFRDYGKIDAADENDQRHAHGHDAKHGDLIEHIEEVPHRHELVCREGEEKAEHDEPDQRTGRPTQGRKQSAGKSPSFLDCRHHQRFSSKPDRRIYTAVRINIH